ncbi:MAG: N-acetylglucosamine-6-phosphate deacetylase [Planctomycetota bacterium]
MSGWVDLQVNGFAGVDFNSDTFDDDSAIDAATAITNDGVRMALATIITAPLDLMVQRIKHIANLIDQYSEFGDAIGGIHIEGPFLNPESGYIGAHPPDCAMPSNIDIAKRLVDAGRGHVRMMTLAPEMDTDAAVTRWLADHSILVSAGHCGPELDQLKRHIDQGLRMFTHLGNGCPAIQPRHDNIIQRVLHLSDQIAISFIADGHHVPPVALSNYLRCVPNENIIIVSDAICAAAMPPGEYRFSHQKVTVMDDRSAWAPGGKHYAGCATTMSQMRDVLRDQLSVSHERSRRWMSHNPERLLGR